MEKQWYAVYTKPRWEKKTADLLTKRKIENYCPLNKVVRNWSDRKKTILEPLFKSYVFVKITDQEQITIKKTDGIINFVYWLGKPAIVKDAEIEAVRSFLDEYQNVRLEHLDIRVNDLVKIKTGPFMFQEGDIMEIKNKTVRVNLFSMGYTLVAEVDTSNIEVIRTLPTSQDRLPDQYKKAI